ncbi:MAG: uroporphyrinogen decarboxylase [Deltaproteobacteria bacterium]|nr:uroporphyrinogen decarboxylase [Deltaproteobacteria bacterium]
MNPRERFLKACRGAADIDRPPVWLMRQAGRYLPEYREIREKYDFLAMCQRSDLAVEVSLQPWRRFRMDAVIVFSDILLIPAAMGVRLSFEKNHGPVFDRPCRSRAELERYEIPNIRRSLAPTLDALETLRSELRDDAALLGFAGAPWTVAAYLVEGGSGDFSAIRKLLHEDPTFVEELLGLVTHATKLYVIEQIRSGADAIQLFDSWGGMLSPEEFRRFSLPSIKTLVAAIREAGASPIVFVRDSEKLFDAMLESGADVLSVGPTVDLGEAIAKAKGKVALQGNLDPETLFRTPHVVSEETKKMLAKVGGTPGYIANLGHGVLPQTRPESVGAFVETVKNFNTP